MISRKNMHIAVVLAVVVVVIFILLGLFGVGRSSAPAATSQPAAVTNAQQLLEKINQQGGVTQLTKFDSSAGTGEGAKVGDTVTVQYTGALPNGTVFDTSRQAGRGPFPVTLGQNKVIQGWELGLLAAKVGERFILAIPPELGYGANQLGPIPPNSTLIFDIEVLSITPAVKPAQ